MQPLRQIYQRVATTHSKVGRKITEKVKVRRFFFKEQNSGTKNWEVVGWGRGVMGSGRIAKIYICVFLETVWFSSPDCIVFGLNAA